MLLCYKTGFVRPGHIIICKVHLADTGYVVDVFSIKECHTYDLK